MSRTYAMPAPAASVPAPPTFTDLWAAEAGITIPSYRWRWTDACILVFVIVQTVFIVGLICRDADLTVELFNLKEGWWADKIKKDIMREVGRNLLKEEWKEEVVNELRREIAREQSKRGPGPLRHSSTSAAQFTKDNSDYADRTVSMNGDGWRHGGQKPIFGMEGLSQAGNIVPPTRTRLVEIPETEW